MTYVFSNNQIYQIAKEIMEHPIRDDTYIPIKYNFHIQKNIEVILKEYYRIENHKNEIINHYGETQDGTFMIPKEKIDLVNTELAALGEIEQQINLTKIPLSSIENLDLTTGELKSIIFMIEDKEE